MSVSVSVRGLPEAAKLFDSLSGRELQNRTRRAARAGAGVMRKRVRAKAQEPQYPRSFRKTATRGHRTPVGVSTGPVSPLLNIFEGGATSHPIGESGQLLTNFGRDSKQSGGESFFSARGPVQHPGFGARPLIGPVFEETKDDAADKAMDVLLEGLR